MSVFRNDNESAYVGGKKHFLDVIKNTAPSGTWAWVQPEEDFNNNSRLIVNPGEEAIFVNGGRIEYVFNQAGTYILNTDNYPFLSRLRNILSGGISVFNCKVYFFRNTILPEVKWGLGNISVQNDRLGAQVEVCAHGSYHLRITTPEKVLNSTIGSDLSKLTADTFPLKRLAAQTIKDAVKQIVLEEYKDELTELNNDAAGIADRAKISLSMKLEQYGFECAELIIENFDFSDEFGEYIQKIRAAQVQTHIDRNNIKNAGQERILAQDYSSKWIQKQREDHHIEVMADIDFSSQEELARLTKQIEIAKSQRVLGAYEATTKSMIDQIGAKGEADIKRINAIADRIVAQEYAKGHAEEISKIGGMNYFREKLIEVLMASANNPNSGGAAAAGMNAGMQFGTLAATSDYFSSVIHQILHPEQNYKSGSASDSEEEDFDFSDFEAADNMPDEDEPKQNSKWDKNYFAQKMAELKELLEIGMYNQEEYDNERKKLQDEWRKTW